MNWTDLFTRPDDQLPEAQFQGWFDRIAKQLLCQTTLYVNNQPHRLVEIEFYYYSKEHHPDIFAHRDPIQLELGRWYFHRTEGTYRSGSFKGVDISFGDGTAHGGVLIRGIEKPDGELVDGPSLCVDHLLDCTGADDVAALDRAINQRCAWESGNPLRLEETAIEDHEIHPSARVGLSLKRFKRAPNPPRFIIKPYRYLTEPNRTKKGRAYLILALHAQGKSTDEIRELTGSTRSTIQRYVDDFEMGRRQDSFDPYYGVELKANLLCQLHGTWHNKYQ